MPGPSDKLVCSRSSSACPYAVASSSLDQNSSTRICLCLTNRQSGGSGHSAMLTDPARLSQVVLLFLSSWLQTVINVLQFHFSPRGSFPGRLASDICPLSQELFEVRAGQNWKGHPFYFYPLVDLATNQTVPLVRSTQLGVPTPTKNSPVASAAI